MFYVEHFLELNCFQQFLKHSGKSDYSYFLNVLRIPNIFKDNCLKINLEILLIKKYLFTQK